MRLAGRFSGTGRGAGQHVRLFDAAGYATDPTPLRDVFAGAHHRGVGRAGFRQGPVRVESFPVTRVLHLSDLHWAYRLSERLDSLKELTRAGAGRRSGLRRPDAALLEEGVHAGACRYLDEIGEVAPYIIIPGNHDIRWLGAVWRNMGGLFRKQAHEFKYSRYKKFICEDLTPSSRCRARSSPA